VDNQSQSRFVLTAGGTHIYGHGLVGFSDLAPAIKRQFGGLPEGLNLSATVGLALPTGGQSISGSSYNPYPQLPWTQDLGNGWTATAALGFAALGAITLSGLRQ
jgi:hypothetical protein